MGGIAGHMTHVYADIELSLQDLLNIIDGVSSGDITVSEKADGQNIFSTTDPAQIEIARLARNNSDIKINGRPVEQMKSDFLSQGKEVQAMIYGEGGEALEKILNQLPLEVMEEVFADPRIPKIYANCEIIHEKKPNMLVYDKNYILFHNFATHANDNELAPEFNPNTVSTKRDLIQELERKYELFINAVNGITSTVMHYDKSTGKNIPLVFTAGGQQYLPSPRQSYQQKEKFEELEMFDQLADTTKNALIDLFKQHLVNNVLPEIGVAPQFIEDAVMAFIYGVHCPFMYDKFKDETNPYLDPSNNSFNKAKFTNHVKKSYVKLGIPKPLVAFMFKTTGTEAKQRKMFINQVLFKLKKILHTFSEAVVNSVESVLAANPQFSADVVREMMRNIDVFEAELKNLYSDNQERLDGYLQKLAREVELLGDVEKLTTSLEGVVFKYARDGENVTYKFTGPFAPANQIAGLAGFETKEKVMADAIAKIKGITQETSQISESYLRRLIRKALIKVLR